MATFVARMIAVAGDVEKCRSIPPLPPYHGQPDSTAAPADSTHFKKVNRLSQAGVVTGGPQARPQ